MVQQAVSDIFRSNRFSICDLDNVLKIIDAPQDAPAYRLLRALHCVNYTDMQPELRERIPHLVNECLRPPVLVNAATEIALQGVTA